MFVRVKNKSNGKQSIQIVESCRRGDKVSQKIVRHVGQASNEREMEELKRLARSIIAELENARQPVLPFLPPEKVYDFEKSRQKADDSVHMSALREEQRIVVGIGDVFGKLYRDLSFDQIISGTKKDKQWNAILKTCVLARVANPVSKRETASYLERDYGIKVPLEKIYRMIDHVAEQEDKIKKTISNTTLNLFDQKVDVLFFDVTTLYFESAKQDELKDFGFSKDCKFKEVQIVLSLVTTTSGMPIAYEIFPGNMYEGHTLIEMVKKLRKDYSISNVMLVADRGMFNEDNLVLMEKENIKYIVAAKLKSMGKEIKNSILEDNGYRTTLVSKELHWVKELKYKSRRLIVSYSTKRARKDSSDRQRLIDRLMKKVKNGKIKIKDIIPNYGTKKYLKVTRGEACVDRSKIAQDAKWDGLHGIITNVNKKSAQELLGRYRGLWQIEEAFRVNKHNLKMRPIYHWTPQRIRGHVAICFLAYALIKQAMYRIEQQQTKMSLEQIRNELLHAQSSLLVDIETKKKYLLPSKVTVNQRKIYQVFGLKRSEVPEEY
ncbi:MAG: IS1634 family transposase, partial [Bacteriovoracaceae bacterium]|nr:IS1634 family transposase [Bacteriovoracaceae bacterium]